MRYSFEAKRLIKISTKADTKRDEGLTVPEDITYIDNFKYGEDEEFQMLMDEVGITEETYHF